jgi:signal transduction histidine kinase
MIVKIVDASGRAVVTENPTLVGAGADLSQEPPVAMAFASSGAGALEFRTPHGPMVAGYARVSSLGWVAVTEYPAATVLAGVTAGRFMGFGVLIAALVSSTVIAMLVTSHLVQPLNELGRAVGSLADDEVSRALPRSTFSEIRWLAALFGGMRDRLAARTAERERALTQAREAVRVRDQFLSVAAHELKTPVTAIRGYAALLRRRVVSNSLTGDELCTALLRIERQSYALGRLTEHLLDLASLEEGKLALNCQTMDLRDVLINAVAGTPYSERIRMSLPDVPREGSFDTLRLGQALRNLLDNAVKFGPADTYIELSLDGHDDKARIQVSDTGEGIPIEHRARVFERLHQAHSDSHRSGLGLGLYLAREIVELHGGSIGVEFPAAGGTRFFLDLPLGTAAEIHSGVESL